MTTFNGLPHIQQHPKRQHAPGLEVELLQAKHIAEAIDMVLGSCFRAQGTPAGFRRLIDRQSAPAALDMLTIVDDAHQRAQDGAEAACREFDERDVESLKDGY